MSETGLPRDLSNLLDMLDSAETFDEQGRHVLAVGSRATAHLTTLCRVDVCGREAQAALSTSGEVEK